MQATMNAAGAHAKPTGITPEAFVSAAKAFSDFSEKLITDWTYYENENDILHTHLKKEEFITHRDERGRLFIFRAEYVIYYNLSYGVPGFSFNVWNTKGKLLSLDEVREVSLIRISKEDFYSVVTQQEHPVLYRPYFMLHPCETADLLSMFQRTSKNLIVTFLSLVTPLIPLDLPMLYGKI